MIKYFDPVELDSRARPFAEQHAVADFDVDGNELAGLITAAGADGDHLSLRRLLFGGIRNDDFACGLIFGVDARNYDAVVKWPKLHINLPKRLFMLSFLTKKRSTAVVRRMRSGSSLTGAPLALVKCDCQVVVSNSAVMLLTP